VYVYTHVYVGVFVCMYISMNDHLYQMYIRQYVCMYTHMYHICMYTYIYTRTHTYAYVYLYKRKDKDMRKTKRLAQVVTGSQRRCVDWGGCRMEGGGSSVEFLLITDNGYLKDMVSLVDTRNFLPICQLHQSTSFFLWSKSCSD